MNQFAIGHPTHYTRVERWECDTNNHWNTRFYGRAFQMAAETAAILCAGRNPGGNATRVRHMRFHRELFVGAPVEIRSAVLKGGAMNGALLHQLGSMGKLSATALDLPGCEAGMLPAAEAADLPLALPRGIEARETISPALLDETGPAVELGPVRPHDLDHTGALLFETLLRYIALASHRHMAGVGYTPEFIARSRISRMNVEMRVLRGASCAAGETLRARSALLRVDGKRFWTAHRITSFGGAHIVSAEQCLVAVNLDERRAVPVPEFMVQALSRG